MAHETEEYDATEGRDSHPSEERQAGSDSPHKPGCDDSHKGGVDVAHDQDQAADEADSDRAMTDEEAAGVAAAIAIIPVL